MKPTIDLRLGDCLEILPTLGRVDAVITDPPYGLDLGIANDKRRRRHYLGRKAYSSYEDTYTNFVEVIVPRIDAALAIAGRGAVFTGPHIQEQSKASAMGGIYHPSATGRTSWGFKNFLPILFYGKAPDLNKGHHPIVLRSTASAEKVDHPCPKPLEWMLWLVGRATRPGDIVLDPFMGSGTTGVAAVRLGYHFIGIESHEPYFRIAERRIHAEVDRTALLDGARLA